jgi:NAD(P)-dependent dehydrogenase (short-subunit alcohol dehydrogenase family)
MTTLAASMFRDGLLEGSSVLIATAAAAAADGSPRAPAANAAGGPPVDAGDSPVAAVAAACSGLGARVVVCTPASGRVAGARHSEDPDAAGDQVRLRGEAVEVSVRAALGEAAGLDLLVVDCAGLFAHALAGGPGGTRDAAGDDGARDALDECLQDTWNVTRAVVELAFLPGGRGGRIVYLAPAAEAARHADAARAGLENLARTLSIEWARHGITSVTIAPGRTTTAGEIAALTAYLASQAGAYFSGCLLDLRGPAAR